MLRRMWPLLPLGILLAGFGAPPLWAGTAGDYGDAPDPTFPSKFLTQSARFPNRAGPYHLDVSKEWIGRSSPNLPSTTTVETDATGSDSDDGSILVRRIWLPEGPTPEGMVTVPVTISATAPTGRRYLNIAVDLNGDGVWAAYTAGNEQQPEWVARNLPVNIPPGYSLDVTTTFRLADLPAGRQPRWARATLTVEELDPLAFGADGWDGSGPPTGFSRGETEDHPVVIGAVTLFAEPSGVLLQTPIPASSPALAALERRAGAEPAVAWPAGLAPLLAPPVDPKRIPDFPTDFRQGHNECVPTSTTRSLYWLAAKHGFTDKLGANPVAVREKLKTCMQFQDGVYVDTNFIPCKDKLDTELGIPKIETAQAPAGGSQAFLGAELRANKDVELVFSWKGPVFGNQSPNFRLLQITPGPYVAPVYPITVRFENRSTVTHRTLWFKIARLDGAGCTPACTVAGETSVRRPDGGDDRYIPIALPAAGLPPGGTFQKTIEVRLVARLPFAFFVDVYGYEEKRGSHMVNVVGIDETKKTLTIADPGSQAPPTTDYTFEELGGVMRFTNAPAGFEYRVTHVFSEGVKNP